MAYADNLTNPFGEKVNFHIIEKGLEPNGEKLGTYGVIKGASSFIGVSVANTELHLLWVSKKMNCSLLFHR